ncbi:MAG TPA: phosphoenolpyruvate carboxykinase (ATP) [Candidatus Saccharimonadales bacterium]|nr:phosphoenolpyruvate carboxykinase (ATP) [Candidatus Saccharimonadales bacterium]
MVGPANEGIEAIGGGENSGVGEFAQNRPVEQAFVEDFLAGDTLRGGNIVLDPSTERLFEAIDPSDPEKAEKWGVTITDTGAWAEKTAEGQYARNPEITFFVDDGEEGDKVAWGGDFQAAPRDGFRKLLEDSLATLGERETFVTERSVIDHPEFSVPVTTITDGPTSAAFSNNMFLPRQDNSQSRFNDQEPIRVIMMPREEDKIDPSDYGLDGLVPEDKLDEDGRTAMIISDPDTNTVIIRGYSYHGPIKKCVYTLVNHFAPDYNVLPMHASAVELPDGTSALISGLSGTGKSTLSNIIEDGGPAADDEILVAVDNQGNLTVINLENGVYPKVIGISEEDEPRLFNAAFTPRDPRHNRTIFQNVVVRPDGSVDVDDGSITENTRVSVPVEYLKGAKQPGVSGAPSRIIFATKDATGTTPAIAQLDPEQAELYNLLGPTSKTSAEVGAQVGATFSPFFGGPFFPREPQVYLKMFRELVEHENGPTVHLVNTGNVGGPIQKVAEKMGIEPGKRVSIPATSAMVNALVRGDLDDVRTRRDPVFGTWVPVEIPGSDEATALLDQREIWEKPDRYEEAASAYAGNFRKYFEEKYGESKELAHLEKSLPA